MLAVCLFELYNGRREPFVRNLKGTSPQEKLYFIFFCSSTGKNGQKMTCECT